MSTHFENEDSLLLGNLTELVQFHSQVENPRETPLTVGRLQL